MKTRKGWRKKSRMRRRKWTTEQGEEAGTVEGTALKCSLAEPESLEDGERNLARSSKTRSA